MSYSVNKATILGNIGGDPEVRSTSNGGRVATFSVATSRRWKSKDGEQQEKTQWHRIVVWNRGSGGVLADVVERYARKGDKIYIEGEIEYRQWEDKEGQTRYTTEINAQQLVLLGGGNGSGNTGERQPAVAAAPKGKDQNFEEFPEALDEDDDLPF